MKKIIKLLTILSVLMLTQSALQAQRPGPRAHRGPALEHLAEELNITEEQKTELKAMHEAQMEKMKALRDQEFDSREAHREAMKALRDEQRTAMEKILTAEQLQKLEDLKAEKEEKRTEQRKERMEGHKAMRAEMKTYHETEVLPVLKEQRAKLEAKLSAEDKATIAGLREKMEARKAMREAAEPRERGQRQRPELSEEQKAAFKADREALKALVEKYDADIVSLLDEVKSEREGWREDMREIGEKYAPEKPEFREERSKKADAEGKGQAKFRGDKKTEHRGKGDGRHARRHGPRSNDMGKTGFLLLDPSTETTSNVTNKADFAKIRVFPNPSASLNTINFTVEEAGHYRVELRDKNGQVLQQLSNEYRQSGQYQDEVDMSQYPSGTYYLSITGADGVVSEKVVKQ